MNVKREVLRPRVIERALEIAAGAWEKSRSDGSAIDRVQRELARINTELTNLAETAARAGAVSAIFEALARRDEDRPRCVAELEMLKRSSVDRNVRLVDVRGCLRGYLDEWHDLLSGDAVNARALLDVVLADRIRFRADVERRRYELTIPIAFDRVLVAVVPELQNSLQEMVTSPTGRGNSRIPFERVFRAA